MPSTNLGMRVHHTKNKGDLGVLHAQLDLAKRGWTICLPQTEHAEFDLIAYKDGRFLRVQVKYRAAVNGLVAFPLTTCWADKHGVHSVAIDKNAIDVFCVYCPDTDRCYYVEPRKVSRSVHIRISPPPETHRSSAFISPKTSPKSQKIVGFRLPPQRHLSTAAASGTVASRKLSGASHAPIAHLDRASDFYSLGSRFESCWAHDLRTARVNASIRPR